MHLPLKPSLFSQLFLTFLITAAMLFLVATMTFRHMAEERPENVIAQKLLQGITQQIGTPPDVETAQQIADHVTGQLAIIGPNMMWSSREAPSTTELSAQCEQLAEHQYTFYSTFSVKNVVYRAGSYCYQFADLATPLSTQGKGYFLLGILGVLIVLFIAYSYIRRLFLPIQAINTGVQAIAAGQLHHRITVVRQDELGNLTQSVNKMADQIKQMLDAKQSLLLAISHELASPLTQARLLAEMIEQPRLKTKLCDALSRLQQLTTALLEAERLNHNHRALQLDTVDLADIAQKLHAAYGANLNIDTPITLPVEADALRLELLLRNLIDNALKYAPNDPATLVITPEKNSYQLCVSDRGAGIPQNHIDQLCHAFYRPDEARTRKQGGFGLGLYLVKAITHAHQGHLAIKSQVSHGTTVCITLPYTLSKET